MLQKRIKHFYYHRDTLNTLPPQETTPNQTRFSCAPGRFRTCHKIQCLLQDNVVFLSRNVLTTELVFLQNRRRCRVCRWSTCRTSGVLAKLRIGLRLFHNINIEGRISSKFSKSWRKGISARLGTRRNVRVILVLYIDY